MNTIFRFFLQGLILFIPLGITIIVFVKLFQFFENLFSFVGLTGNSILDTIISFVSLIILITLIGILASSFIFKRLFIFIEDRLEHAPFIRHVYSPIKDFMNAFMGNKKKFTKPVLVLTNPIFANVIFFFWKISDCSKKSNYGFKDRRFRSYEVYSIWRSDRDG